MSPANRLWIAAELARHFGVTPRQIAYAIKVNEIEPVYLAGNRSVFDNGGLERVRKALHRTKHRHDPSESALGT